MVELKATVRTGLAALMVLALASCAGAPRAVSPDAPRAQEGFSFAVISDVPYSADDDAMLARAVPAIQSGGFAFVTHLGDTKSGGLACDGSSDDRLAALFAALKPLPVFFTPGDNDWTDCDRFPDPATGAPHSELSRLATLRARFFASPAVPAGVMAYSQQGGLPENSTWRHDGVRFVLLHVVGTNNGRSWVTGDDPVAAGTSADARDAANLAWLRQAADTAQREGASALVIGMQADISEVDGPAACGVPVSARNPCDGFLALRNAVQEAARQFQKPVLLMHGDTTPFAMTQTLGPAAGPMPPNLWRLNVAGDVDSTPNEALGSSRDVTLVTVSPGAAVPFQARGLLGGPSGG